MKISLIIPTYNRRESLKQCLQAAIIQDHPEYEVIVIDDASIDGTETLVRDEFPNVSLIRQNINRGPAIARNRGIAEANGEIIAFTDDDCLIPTNFLSSLENGYRSFPDVVGVGGFLEAPAAMIKSNPWAKYEYYVTHKIYKASEVPYRGGYECPAGGTNSMSYKKDILLAVGGFDETFPHPGGEDADLKLRIIQTGQPLLYIPVKVTHLRPYYFRNFWRQHYAHGQGTFYFERKHNKKLTSRSHLFLRYVARITRWFLNLIRMKDPVLATVNLIAEIANLTGQCEERRALQVDRKYTR